MATDVVEIQGTLQADGTLVLDEKLNLPPGRVRVRVQPAEAPANVIDVLRRIHAEQAARRYVPRSVEEIDADIAAMRQEDEERMQAIERLHEEYEQAQCQEPPGAAS